MRNVRLRTKLTLAILIVNTVCISLLYFVASRSMTSIMKQSEMGNLHVTLNAQTNMIEEYIYHQEDLLIAFSRTPAVIDFLKDPENEQKRIKAQEHTEKFYSRMQNWEGLYIGEWDTHVIAHSNPDVVGMTTREGESLRQLQEEMLSRDGLYNAGIIVSPASQKLVLSLYYPVFDYDGETIIGYVGGGPFAEELNHLLSSIKEENTKYYMINVPSKMYIFAEDEELMATEIHDEMLLSVISKSASKSDTWYGSIEYLDDKEGKSIAAYQYIPEYDWAVVSCNSEKNIYASVTKNTQVLASICIFSDLLIGILSFVFIHLSIKPLKYVEKAIIQLKQLKLEKDTKLNRYINGKDEVGQIATAIDSLYDSIGDMLDAEKEKQIAIAASESKAKFLASMSHEIRTPINTIIGMNEMILRENQDETVHEYAYNIKSASRMLLGLINDVLDISKIEAGKLQLVESNYYVSSMLKDAILAIEARVRQKDLELKLDIDETLPTVLKGDEMRIKQILNNLLSNAAKYTQEGSVTFTVKGVYEEERFLLEMSVADTGMGIRKEDMERLYESFLRLEIDKNCHIEGTGLGLNITKQLVDNMGGKIEVISEYGKGSCFTVRIPQEIVDKTAIGKWEQICRHESLQDKDTKNYFCAPDAKVLVVDDNNMNLTVMKALLKRSQIQLETATGGNECLKMTQKKKYDLILMDHMMPEPDGIRTLHLIRGDKENLNQQTTIIVLTANALEGMAEMYLQEGFAGYLSKPIMAEELDEMLEKFLDNKTS